MSPHPEFVRPQQQYVHPHPQFVRPQPDFVLILKNIDFCPYFHGFVSIIDEETRD